jgi:hypothetical protein
VAGLISSGREVRMMLDLWAALVAAGAVVSVGRRGGRFAQLAFVYILGRWSLCPVRFGGLSWQA